VSLLSVLSLLEGAAAVERLKAQVTADFLAAVA
jgi:hypothetical protein